MISSHLSPCSWLTLHSTSNLFPNHQTTIIYVTVRTPTQVPTRTATTSWSSLSTSQATTLCLCPSQTTQVAASGISRTRSPQEEAGQMTLDIRMDSIHTFRGNQRKRMRVTHMIVRVRPHRKSPVKKWRAWRAVTEERSFNRIRWTEHKRLLLSSILRIGRGWDRGSQRDAPNLEMKTGKWLKNYETWKYPLDCLQEDQLCYRPER